MKSYLSIDGPSRGQKGNPCIAFVKYDGSNIRAEWSAKRGWYKFGTRKTLFDHTSEVFAPAIPLFLNKYGESIPSVLFKDKSFRGVRSIVAYFEYFGSKSFAGMHLPNDEKDVVLFDVNPITKGIIGPKKFLDTFGHLNVAEVVFQGNYGQQLIDAVREETLDINSKYQIRPDIPEGVICKGGSGHGLWMCKIKTNRYKEKLKLVYEADWLKYWEE